MANNSNYFTNLMKDFENPFTGVGDSFKDLNILGASAPEEFKAMKTAGFLSDTEYQDAINKADTRGKRSAIIQGLLGFGLQNFDKGFGSAFDPRYLKAGLAAAIPAAQKPFDKLASNTMNIEKLKEFKAAKDKEVSRLAMIKDFQSGTYGTVEDGTFTKEQMALFPQLGIAQMYDMIKPKVYAPSNLKKLQMQLSKLTPGTKSYNETQGAITKLTTKEPTSLRFQNVVNKQGLTQKWQVPKGNYEADNNNDGVPDNWNKVGEPYISKEQKDIPSASGSLIETTIFKMSQGDAGFKPSIEILGLAGRDVASVAEQIGETYRISKNPISDAEKINKAIQFLKESKALEKGNFYSNDTYDSEIFLKYVKEQIKKEKSIADITPFEIELNNRKLREKK